MWTAALRDAAGLLAAYITPSEYGLSAFSGEMAIGADPFERELRKRLDLGRVRRFAEMVAILRVEPDRLRRKSIRYTTGEILGTIHIPKYVASLAAGMPDRIPVLQSRYNKRTPENQLIAEGLERSLAVCRSWMGKGGAEGKLATGSTPATWFSFEDGALARPNQATTTSVEALREPLRRCLIC